MAYIHTHPVTPSVASLAERRRRARGRGGYSLVEMMVALTAGAILVSSAYLLSSTSSRSFFRSSRIAGTQAALRLAAEQLRGDIARAGFLGHPDTTGQLACGSQMSLPEETTAVTVSRQQITGGANQVRLDHLELGGNFATNERYDLVMANPDLTIFTLDPTDSAFQRSFFSVDGQSYSPEAFANAFQPGRMVRIEAFQPQHRTFFRAIQSVTTGNAAGSPPTFGTNPTVTLSAPFPTGCGIPGTNFEEGFISPVSTIDYQMVDPSTVTGLSNLAWTGGANGANQGHVLLRRELDHDAGDFYAGSERVALEYAVEFGITALYCPAAGVICNLNQLEPQTDPSGLISSQIQALRIHLAARTPEKDPSFDPSGAFNRGSPFSGNPLRSWEVAGPGTGRARVRSTTFEAALMNNLP